METISEVNATAIKRMVETTGWGEFTREVGLMIEDLRDMLEQGSHEDERTRGRIDALREILAWPAAVTDTEMTHAMDKILPQGQYDARDQL